MEINKFNNYKKHGYWRNDWGDGYVYCGHYIDGEPIGIWRLFRNEIITKLYLSSNRLRVWEITYSKFKIEYYYDDVLHVEHYE